MNLPKKINTMIRNIQHDIFDYDNVRKKKVYYREPCSVTDLKSHYGSIGYIIEYMNHILKVDFNEGNITITNNAGKHMTVVL